VPFEKVFAKKHQDRHLVEKLRPELPGILNWAIAGCIEWKRKGLREPKKILEAVSQYRNDNDILKTFLSESAEESKAYTVRASQLYGAYRVWIEENGHRPLSATKLKQRLADKGYGHTRDKHGAQYSGLRLRVGGGK
jgi:putative DNA primase/helicase